MSGASAKARLLRARRVARISCEEHRAALFAEELRAERGMAALLRIGSPARAWASPLLRLAEARQDAVQQAREAYWDASDRLERLLMPWEPGA